MAEFRLFCVGLRKLNPGVEEVVFSEEPAPEDPMEHLNWEQDGSHRAFRVRGEDEARWKYYFFQLGPEENAPDSVYLYEGGHPEYGNRDECIEIDAVTDSVDAFFTSRQIAELVASAVARGHYEGREAAKRQVLQNLSRED